MPLSYVLVPLVSFLSVGCGMLLACASLGVSPARLLPVPLVTQVLSVLLPILAQARGIVPLSVLREGLLTLLSGLLLVLLLHVLRLGAAHLRIRQRAVRTPSAAWRRMYFWTPEGTITAESIGQFLDARPQFRASVPLPALRAAPRLQATAGPII